MNSKNESARKLLATLSKAILLLSLCASMTSCAHSTIRIIPSDKAVTILKQGQAITAPNDGVFVPDALWIEINEALLRKNFQK